MHIILNNSSMTPIYEQLVDQIKNSIIDGGLQDNEPLPSVRRLSADLRISALTVKKAYDKLEEDGFVTTVHGKGTFVNSSDKSLALEARKKAVEDELAHVLEKAQDIGMTRDDIAELIEIFFGD